MTQPTPGPWSIERKRAYWRINGPKGEAIAETGAWLPDEQPEMDANARLIVQSPALVEALQPLASLYRKNFDAKPDDYPIYGTEGLDGRGTITVGDCRRARAILAEIDKGA